MRTNSLGTSKTHPLHRIKISLHPKNPNLRLEMSPAMMGSTLISKRQRAPAKFPAFSYFDVLNTVPKPDLPACVFYTKAITHASRFESEKTSRSNGEKRTSVATSHPLSLSLREKRGVRVYSSRRNINKN